MIGIILVSHGDMALGMVNSAEMFFDSSALQQITTVSLYPEMNTEEFDELLSMAIEEVDRGDGVVILADLIGGTPCNRAAHMCSAKVRVITGMNLSLLVELIGSRNAPLKIDSLIKTAQGSILDYNKLLESR